jgi:hypothetical protein
MIAPMANDDAPELRETIQWLITFCLVIAAVVLSGVVIGALLRGSGVR